jgi:hypothetical protein
MAVGQPPTLDNAIGKGFLPKVGSPCAKTCNGSKATSRSCHIDVRSNYKSGNGIFQPLNAMSTDGGCQLGLTSKHDRADKRRHHEVVASRNEPFSMPMRLLSHSSDLRKHGGSDA